MPVRILGIETSCDETAVAVVEEGRRILSNVIASQVELHARYGGVVPEVASRQHVLAIGPTVQRALSEARLTLREVDAVAVTSGPGLAGSLLVGVNTAKALALALGVPLLGINHLEGHIYASWLEGKDPAEEPGFPLLCLIASGGHTDLVLMQGHGNYRLLGRTRDDAAGEAFDKAARLLGLGFPGGPQVQRVAQGVRVEEPLPRAWLRDTHDFSFSGVKTALLHRAQAQGVYPAHGTLDAEAVARLAAAFQESVVEVMVTKTLEAAREVEARGVLLGGGVAANALLRQSLLRRATLPVLIPSPILCTDNGAMIAACAFFHLRRGESHGLELDADPAARLG
ncbi:MAG: tRNA (adenosine(37)-N6)-threonylcarbamoyltransferase complex transferase subunit TsaD [Dehalococcoidia bacterium]